MQLYQLNYQIFEATKKQWTESLKNGPDISPSSYFHTLDSAELHLGEAAKNRDHYYVYGLCASENGPASALVDISYAAPGQNGWIKVMSIRPSPDLDIRQATPETFLEFAEKLGEVAGRIITESLRLSYETFPTNKVKIYAGHNVDHKLLTLAIKELPKESLMMVGIRIDQYGQWVEFTKNAK